MNCIQDLLVPPTRYSSSLMVDELFPARLFDDNGRFQGPDDILNVASMLEAQTQAKMLPLRGVHVGDNPSRGALNYRHCALCCFFFCARHHLNPSFRKDVCPRDGICFWQKRNVCLLMLLRCTEQSRLSHSLLSSVCGPHTGCSCAQHC